MNILGDARKPVRGAQPQCLNNYPYIKYRELEIAIVQLFFGGLVACFVSLAGTWRALGA
jgi:hypothetical protein